MNMSTEGIHQSELPTWLADKIDLAKQTGYGFCIVYAEPENHESLCSELKSYDLEARAIRLFPARTPDMVRLADGDPFHMPILLKWADPIVVERQPATKTKRAKKAPKAKVAASKATAEESPESNLQPPSKKPAGKKTKKGRSAKPKKGAASPMDR